MWHIVTLYYLNYIYTLSLWWDCNIFEKKTICFFTLPGGSIRYPPWNESWWFTHSNHMIWPVSSTSNTVKWIYTFPSLAFISPSEGSAPPRCLYDLSVFQSLHIWLTRRCPPGSVFSLSLVSTMKLVHRNCSNRACWIHELTDRWWVPPECLMQLIVLIFTTRTFKIINTMTKSPSSDTIIHWLLWNLSFFYFVTFHSLLQIPPLIADL